MKFSVVAVLVALCCVALAAEQPLRSKRQLIAPYASPYLASPYVAASPYVSAPYVSAPYVSAPYVASPYNGASYYNSGPIYAQAYSSAYYSPYAYL